MQRRQKWLGRGVRCAAVVLCVLAAGAGAWACGIDTPKASATAEVDLGPTFGLEVSIVVRGRGRVVSDPVVLDCPAKCFARVVLSDTSVDGSTAGISLTPSASLGSHFAGWSYESVGLGVRARGPAECSPMKRWTSVLPAAKNDARLVLPYGETAGTPPPGLEAACASFTRVPVAYALTATFAEDSVAPPPPERASPPIEVLYEPPMLGAIVAREIGIAGGRLYWRFDRKGFGSGVATGQPDGSGGGSTVIVQPFDQIRRFHVDRAVIYQNGPENQGGYVDTIDPGATTTRRLTYLSYPCAALATDGTTAYCRATSGVNVVTYLFAMPLATGGQQYLFSLPPGNDLALDDQSFFLSEDRGALANQAYVGSTPRFFDGGPATSATMKNLVPNQTAPRALTMSADSLFWLDDQAGGFSGANTAPKDGLDGGVGLFVRPLPGALTLAVDPTSPSTFYVALAGTQGPGDSYIVKATASSSNVTSFRRGLGGIGGLAVDATHVYWTQTDGRVYRAPKD